MSLKTKIWISFNGNFHVEWIIAIFSALFLWCVWWKEKVGSIHLSTLLKDYNQNWARYEAKQFSAQLSSSQTDQERIVCAELSDERA